MAKISAIVPVYKVEKYLRRCIDSILAQTFEDFELILVDDGSPDRCPEICDEYAQKDNRIKVIHKENGGLSSARNAGIRAARGEYVLFCDSDDYVAVNWCSVLYETAVKYPDSFIVSNIFTVSDGDMFVKCKSPSTVYNNVQSGYFQIYKSCLSAYAVNKIYLLEKIKRHGIYFDENCFFAEDVGFNARYCMACSSAVYIDIPLYYYFIANPDSIMNKYRENLFDVHLPLFSSRLSLISDIDLPEYCDIWLYQFIKLFDNVFDKRCSMNFFEKIKYNQKMMNSMEFVFCLEKASGKKENPKIIKLLKKHNYYLFWIFNRITKLKSVFIGGKV